MPLNYRQQLFVHEYLIDSNATQAAIRAGYSEKTAGAQAHKLLKVADIATAIATAQERVIKRLEYTQERVAIEYARIAFATIGDVATWDEEQSRLIPSGELDIDAMPAIKEIKASRTIHRDGRSGDTTIQADTRVVMHDKKGALDSLARMLGMFNQDNDTETPSDEPRRVRIELDTTNRLTAGREGD